VTSQRNSKTGLQAVASAPLQPNGRLGGDLAPASTTRLAGDTSWIVVDMVKPGIVTWSGCGPD
jgi:hypothetical protein